jgi:hypothetical protein
MQRSDLLLSIFKRRKKSSVELDRRDGERGRCVAGGEKRDARCKMRDEMGMGMGVSGEVRPEGERAREIRGVA